ncbi:MAG TPA: hypothetical protein VGI30_03030, partial [Caulobacteraceae bacterium]
EWGHDPLPRLHDHLVPAQLSEAEWGRIGADAAAAVEAARARAEARLAPDTAGVGRFVFSEAG